MKKDISKKKTYVLLERHKYFYSATPTQRQRLSSEMYAERTPEVRGISHSYAKRRSKVRSDKLFLRHTYATVTQSYVSCYPERLRDVISVRATFPRHHCLAVFAFTVYVWCNHDVSELLRTCYVFSANLKKRRNSAYKEIVLRTKEY